MRWKVQGFIIPFFFFQGGLRLITLMAKMSSFFVFSCGFGGIVAAFFVPVTLY